MSTATVSIDRSALSLSPLVIADDGATYRLTERGLGRPGVTWRMGAMPDSADVHGTEYISAAKEQSSLPLEVAVTASTTSALSAAVVALEAAVSQFSYDVTVTVDGVGRTWSCGPASYASANGAFDAGMVAAHFDVLSITIPVYPIPEAS